MCSVVKRSMLRCRLHLLNSEIIMFASISGEKKMSGRWWKHESTTCLNILSSNFKRTWDFISSILIKSSNSSMECAMFYACVNVAHFFVNLSSTNKIDHDKEFRSADLRRIFYHPATNDPFLTVANFISIPWTTAAASVAALDNHMDYY